MRLALFSPKGPLYRHGQGAWKRSLRYAPLTLTTLVSLIPDDVDAQVSIHDEGIETLPRDLDVDLVGMTVITGSARRAYEFADHYRSRGIPVVLGGPHVTLAPDDATPHADAIVTGYAEQTWPELLRDFARGRMRARYDQDPGLELRDLPFPRRDLLPKRRYLTTNTFEATRGCVHKCDFCVVPWAWGRTPYQKPVGEVIADIRQHGARKLIFLDLNLFASVAYARELFEALVPLRVQWYGLSTTLLARKPELVELAARSGCRGLLLGLESLDQDNLDASGKTFAPSENYEEVIAALHRHGIGIQGCFVFGMDHDTEDVFDRTAEFAIRTGIDLPRFAIRTPFPGTKLHHDLDAQGRILHRNWELYDGQHVVFEPKLMSVDALQRGHFRAWKQVYRLGATVRRLRALSWRRPAVVAANLGYRYYVGRLEQLCTTPPVREPALALEAVGS